MYSDQLILGERVDVAIGEKKCISSVQEITEAGTLILSCPMYRSALIPLPEGELLHIIYYRPSGMFSFVALSTRRFREGALDLIEVELKSPISKYQRRDFVRFDTVLPVSVRLIASTDHIAERSLEDTLRLLYDQRYVGIPRPLLPGEEIYKCYTIDISGGGARFSTEEHFEVGSLLECSFALRDGLDVTVDAQTVRADSDIATGRCRVSTRFVNMDERIRRKIIKYIFDRQANAARRD